MPEFNAHTVDNIIKEKEKELHHSCSPYSGHCFEIALALSRIFPRQVEGFWSVYAETDFVHRPDTLPLHITVQIQGELFDAAGQLYKSHLLEGYAPKQDTDLLTFDETFPHENEVNDDTLARVMETYESALEEKYK